MTFLGGGGVNVNNTIWRIVVSVLVGPCPCSLMAFARLTCHLITELFQIDNYMSFSTSTISPH